jgi:hypothetical protein
MRKLSTFILFILIVSVVVYAGPNDSKNSNSSSGDGPSSYISSSETVPATNTTSYISAKMTFTAGVSAGVKVGFSTTPYVVEGDEITSDITTTTKGTLTLGTPEVMGEITATGLWYAYWTIKGNDKNLSINLSWTSDAENLFNVYEDADYTTLISTPTTLKTFESTDSGETATYPLYIKTADLRDWYYNKTYTLSLKLEVQSN